MSLVNSLSSWWRRLAQGPRKRLSRPWPNLGVECLETRTVLNAVANPKVLPGLNIVPDNLATDNYVTELYYDALHRAPSAQEVSAWAFVFNNSGQNRLVVANGIVNSAESLTKIITNDYVHLLGRSPEPAAVPYWLNLLNAGVSTQQLQLLIVSSGEYYARQGGTNAAWLNGLYRDLLGRQPDPVGSLAWNLALQRGLSLPAVAFGFVYSGEENGIQINQAYQDLLGRGADTFGFQAWSGALASGFTWQQLRVSIAASGEEYNAAQGDYLPTTDQWNNIAQWDASPLQVPPDPPAIVVGPTIDVNKEKGQQTEENIAINPANPKQMFASANEDDLSFGMMGSYSTDGGVTWHPRVFGNGSDGLPETFSDPWASFDQFGNLFFSDIGGSSMDTLQIFLSTDGGKTFNSKLLFSETIFDHPELTAANGAIWCTYAVGTASGGIHIECAAAP